MASVTARGRGRRTINEINMVPFIDVMLVLLIIFMVTAPMISPSVVDLPSVGKAAKQADRVVQVIISKDDVLELKLPDVPDKTSSIAIKDIANIVKKEVAGKADTAVVISADKSVKYETVVKVMDELQRKGIARVGLAVQLVK